MTKADSQIPTIDLFAGAGGLSLGAQAAGADVRLMVDNDPVSVATAKRNTELHNGAPAVEADVSDLTGPELRALAHLSDGDDLLVIGGPPCQPFSKAAYWTDPGEDSKYRRARARGEAATKPSPIFKARPDERRTLVEEFWRLVVEARADAFLFENVDSILHPRNRSIIPNLSEAAEQEGFKVTLIRSNAVSFGVPQKRKRVFLLGSKASKPSVPVPTHTFDADGDDTQQPAVSAGAAILPFSGDEYFEEGEVVSGRWASHLFEIPPGWNYKHHTAWAGHPSPTFETETRFWSFLLKLDPDKPSWTIAAAPGPWTGPFHWENRRLRTVEMAALQSFPTGYEFNGNRRERVRQIGNAVPPPLGAAMVGAIIDTIIEDAAAA